MRRLESYNPATGTLVARVPIADAAAVRAAVRVARQAQPRWAATPIAARGHILNEFRRLMLRRADWLTSLISREQGRPQVEALLHEVMGVADLVSYYARHAQRFLADEAQPLHLMKYKRSAVHFVPYGVVAVIAPWNFPFLLPTSEVALALLAGNAVILKPSEYTPGVGEAIAELFRAAGLPDGVLQVVQGDGATGAALVDAPPDKIVFIGGLATARRILTLAAQHLTPVTCELGGKDAMLVLPDADLDRAANMAVWGGFCNAGQACAAVERIYVAQEVAQTFTEKVVERTRALRVGLDVRQGDAFDIGPLNNAQQLATVERHVSGAIAAGARALVGGKRRTGLYFEPTVLVDVTDDMPVMREETFGPVVAIAPVADEAEAICRANDSPLGLCASVFTRSRATAERVARQLQVGSVVVNDIAMTYAAPEAPWGGVKQSGLGRIHWGPHGLRDYCQPRHILLERVRPLPHDLWEFPYRKSTYHRMLFLMRLLWGH